MKRTFIPQIFEQYSNNRYHKNPFSRKRVVPCGRTDVQRGRRTWRSSKSLFHNFAKAPETFDIFKRKLISTSFGQVIKLDWEIITSSSTVHLGYRYLDHGQHTSYDDWKYGEWRRTEMLNQCILLHFENRWQWTGVLIKNELMRLFR